MNSRAIVIAIVALFALCFVGSGAVMTLVLVERMATGEKNFPESKNTNSTNDDEDDREPPTAPEAKLSESPDDDDVIETLEGPRGGTAKFEAPVIGLSQFAVFYPTPSKLPTLPTLQKQLKGTRLKAFRGDAPASARVPYIELKDESTLDYAVIEGASLDNARGLDADVKNKLKKAKTVTVLDVVTPVSASEQLEVAKVIYGFAKATNGVVWDELTQEYFSADAFKERRVDGWERQVPWAPVHFTVFAENSGKSGVTLTTAGLRRFGLAELELHNIPGNSIKAANHLVNIAGQMLVDDPHRSKPGALKVSIAKMKHTGYRDGFEETLGEGAQGEIDVELRAIGDGEIPTLEIVFAGEGEKTVIVERALSTMFGSVDEVNQIQHDEELLSLSKAQMAEFKKSVKPKFLKGLKANEVLLVKAPFKTTSGGNEWMWVEVSDIAKNGTITGLLANDPDDVPELESGQEVKVQEAELFDWILKAGDGSTTGNKTGELMQKRLNKE